MFVNKKKRENQTNWVQKFKIKNENVFFLKISTNYYHLNDRSIINRIDQIFFLISIYLYE